MRAHQRNLGRSLLPIPACPWGEHTPKHCQGHKHTSLFKLPSVKLLGPTLLPVQRLAYKLLSSSRPLSAIPGLHSKPIGRKEAGSPRPPLSWSILLPKASKRPPVGGSQFPSYQVKAREVVDHTGAPRRTQAHSQTQIHSHTHTWSHVLTSTETQGAVT